jgi:hypothetical protein
LQTPCQDLRKHDYFSKYITTYKNIHVSMVRVKKCVK